MDTYRRVSLFFSVIVLLSAANAYSASRADFLLLTHPERCLMLDKYEQPLSRPLPVGAPLRLMQKHILLSDSLTRADKAEFNGKVFFLLSGQEFQETVRRALAVDDTVTIRSKQVRWQPVAALHSAPSLLSQGKRIRRYFKTRRGWYLFSDGFGWARLSKTDVQPFQKPSAASSALPANLAARIRARVEAANQSLRELTAYFNAQLSQQRTAPQWQISRTADTLRIRFRQPGTAPVFKRSLAALKNEIDQILLGAPFGCSENQGTLIVKRIRL